MPAKCWLIPSPPGWIDTAYTVCEDPDAIRQPAGRMGSPLDIANMVLFLASDKAGFITRENICIDGGQTNTPVRRACFPPGRTGRR